jgi:hypothetical protein
MGVTCPLLWACKVARTSPLVTRALSLTQPLTNRLPPAACTLLCLQGLLFLSALAAFETRTLYANSSGDHLVGWANSSLRRLGELPPKSGRWAPTSVLWCGVDAALLQCPCCFHETQTMPVDLICLRAGLAVVLLCLQGYGSDQGGSLGSRMGPAAAPAAARHARRRGAAQRGGAAGQRASCVGGRQPRAAGGQQQR